MNHNPILWLGIIGTVLWVAFIMVKGWPDLRSIYYKYLRPQIKFTITEHCESGSFEIVGSKRILVGIGLYFEGYFENSGGVPSTVKAIETQLVKKVWMLRFPVSKRAIKAAYYLEGGDGLIDSHRGFRIYEYDVSPKIKADSACLCNGNCDVNKFGSNYLIRIRWHVLGQDIKDMEIQPDWDIFRRDVNYSLSRPISGTGNSQT